MKRKILFLISVLLIVAMLAGCANTTSSNGAVSATDEPQNTSAPTETPAEGTDETPEPNGSTELTVTSALSFRYAESESDVLQTLKDANMDSEAPAAEEDSAGDYSETNHQVEGVDEADTVKTNGEYIYAINDIRLEIFRADGEDSTLVSSVTVGMRDDGENGSSVDKNPLEMYIVNDRLTIISSYYSYDASSEDYQSYVAVDFYSLDDPENPALIGSQGQDGYMVDSRVTDGKLYIVTNYYVWNYDEENPDGYLPGIYSEGDRVNLKADEICLFPETMGEGYSIVCQYDTNIGQCSAKLSVQGGADSIYMDDEKLYLATLRNDLQEGEPYTESVYTVTDCARYYVTDVTDIDLETMKVSAAVTVEGQMKNQFSMDRQDGYLRMVTTSNRTEYKIYKDENMDFVNYVYDEDIQSSSNLYILDSELNLTGALTGLAKGEYVYSARFDGDIAYFCTFRQVDPLFAVDVSDPTSPTLLSELKITGFSEYLHVWDDGLLLGIGLEADEESGSSENMKLVMFDNSDPANVTVKTSTDIECNYSPVLYNHRAAFVDKEHNIIGFEDSDSGVYLIYGYDESGFTLRAQVGEGISYGTARGLYIGDYVYVYTGAGLYVLYIDSLEQVEVVSIAVG